MGRVNYCKNKLVSRICGNNIPKTKNIDSIIEFLNKDNNRKSINDSVATLLSKEYDIPKEYILKLKIGPDITLNGSNPIYVNHQLNYKEYGAVSHGNEVIIDSSNVNTNIIGTYYVNYTATDKYGYTNSIKRTVQVFKNEKPIVFLKGDNPLIVYHEYPINDPGIFCTGNANVFTQITENKIVYTATDFKGNSNVITRDIIREYIPVPKNIELIGDNPQRIRVGEKYIDMGATSDFLSEIQIDYMNFNSNVPGEYNVKITALNKSGFKSVYRKVKVIPDIFTVKNTNLSKIFPSKIDSNEIISAVKKFEDIIKTRISDDSYDVEIVHEGVNGGWTKYFDIELISKHKIVMKWNTNNYDRLLSYPKSYDEKSQVYYEVLNECLKLFNINIVLPKFQIIPYETEGDFWPIHSNKVVAHIDEIITHDKPWFISIKLMIKRCKKMWEGESCVFNKSDIIKLNIKEDIKSGNVYPIFKFGDIIVTGPSVKYNYYDTDIDIKYDGFGNFEINVYNSKFHKNVKSFFTINDRNLEIGKNYHGYIKKFSQVRI